MISLPWVRKARSSIAVRIYLVGLVQVLIVSLGFLVFVRINRPPPPHERYSEEHALVDVLSHSLEDPDRTKQLLDAAKSRSGLEATIVDPEGKVLTTTVSDTTATCAAPPLDGPPPRPGMHRPPPSLGPHPPPHARPPGPGALPEPGSRPPPKRRDHGHDDVPGCYTMALPFPDGLGSIEFRRFRSQPLSPFNPAVIGFVLIVVALSTIFLASSIVPSLRRLASVAHELGAGNLSTRTALARNDEIGAVSAAFDEMAARLQDQIQAEKELIANVSHELRTPLARIRVALDIASEGDVHDTRASLSDIAADLSELERLVTDVLTAARLDLSRNGPRGIPPLRKTTVPLGDIIDAAKDRFHTKFPRHRLECRCDEPLPSVHVDPVLLRRALDNLLDNAAKYTEHGDLPIELSVARQPQAAIISIEDRGVGISEEDLAMLFRPFFRADRSRTRATGGLGLGLVLVKRIVEAHGGSLTIRSELGIGTTVVVELPTTA